MSGENTDEINKFQNLYTVQKTITFDLKPKSITDNFEFKNSVKWMESFFSTLKEGFDESKLLELLELSRGLRIGVKELMEIWGNGSGLITDKKLIEFVDRNEYHKIKSKTVKIQELNIEDGNDFQRDYKISNLNPLFVLNKVFGGLGLFESKINILLDNVSKYENKVRHDWMLKNNHQAQHEFSGKVTYFGNIRAWIENLQKLIEVMSWFAIDTRENSIENSLKTVFGNIKLTSNTLVNSKLDLIKDFANDSARKEVELTTLNFKAVNKDGDKIQSEISNLAKLERDVINLERQLESINNQKLEYVKKLDYALTRNLPDLYLLNTEDEDGKYCNELFQIKSKGEKLGEEEQKWIRALNFQKTTLKYLKFKGLLITDKNQVRNYRQSGEDLILKKISDTHKIENLIEYPIFKTEYENYKLLLKQKFTLARKLGDLRSLYNATFREISRQKQCNHFSVICRDDDTENSFYYLILIPNNNKKDLNDMYNNLKQSGEGFEYLDIQRLTFKALDKLALRDISTFDIPDTQLTQDVRDIMKIYKENAYKNYRLNRDENRTIGRPDQQKYIVKMESENLAKLIKYCNECIKKLTKENNYSFQFDYDKKFTDFEDYKNYIDQNCYSKNWVKIDFENVKKLESSGEIRILKIHNKDFRKNKKANQKDNLFTKYWLDGMDQNNQFVRILPEIDIFKRSKEEEKEQKTRSLKTSGKEITEKARIYQDKLQGAFRLEFYPANKKEELENINENIEKQYSKKTFYLGIDRGEKELASYCLMDSKGQLIVNGCWNEQKTNTSDKGINFAHKIKSFYGNGEASIWVKLESKKQAISDENNSEEKYKRITEFKQLEEELQEANELASEYIKKSYCAYLIGEINKILIKYPHTYLVLEDLNIAGKADKDTEQTNREQQILKTLGANAYQVIENALVNKFKYYSVKTGEFQGKQLVPDISKIEDLRIGRSDEKHFGKIKLVKSKDQIGNILFVEEYLTSNQCPNCEFTHEQVYKNRMFAKFEESEIDFKLNVMEHSYSFDKNYYKEKMGVFLQKYSSNQETLTIKENEDFQKSFMPRSKKNGFMKHADQDYFHCPRCKFSTTNCNSEKLKNNEFLIKTGDDVAAYNIAKRGLELLSGQNIETGKTAMIKNPTTPNERVKTTYNHKR